MTTQHAIRYDDVRKSEVPASELLPFQNKSQRTADESGTSESALQLFEHMSNRITESYRELEGRVDQLTGELSTATRNRQRELIEKERLANRLEALLASLPAGVVVLDGQGTVQQCNPAAIDLLGEPLEGEQWRTIIDRCFAPREDDGHEVSLKDGRRVSIDIRSIGDEPGQLILINDLTETRRLQAKLNRHERLSTMGKMLASLAHQIRTPLSAAMLYAGHLNSDNLNAQVRTKCSQKLMARLVHLEQQVRDMLIFAKGETRLVEACSAKQLQAQISAGAEAALQAADAHWQLNNYCHGEQVFCNPDALVGAVLNLINNSIEASQQQPQLKLDLFVDQQQLVIRLRDRGIGLTSQYMKQAMQPFVTTKANGTGLGLAVVKVVVNAHNGEFQLNNYASGAEACIRLPLANRNQA